MTKKRGPTRKKFIPHKLTVVDVKTRDGKIKGGIAALTENEKRALADDFTARMKAFQRRWEASGDPAALAGALVFYAVWLPEWLFKALRGNLEQQIQGVDVHRYLAVHYAHDFLGMTMDEAYDWASENVAAFAAGGRDAMMKSYQKIRKQVPASDRILPRPRKRRRS